MQLKRDDDNNNQQTNGSVNDSNSYYSNSPSDGVEKNVGGNQYGGPATGNTPYGGPGAGNTPYGGPSAGNSPYGGPTSGGSPYGGNDPYSNSYGSAGGGMYTPPVDGGATIKRGMPVPGWLIGIVALIAIGIVVYIFVFSSDYKPGKISGNKFTNGHFGIEIDLDSDFTIVGYSGSESKEKDDLKKSKYVIYELNANNADDTKSLNFAVKYMGQTLESSGYTEKELVQSMKEPFLAEVSDASYNVDIEEESMVIGGKTRYGFMITASAGGMSIYASQFYLFEGNYVAAITSVAKTKSNARSLISDTTKEYSGD